MRHEDLLDKCSELFDIYAVLSAAEDMSVDLEHLQSWLAQGRYGTRNYMTRNRSTPQIILPGAQSLIVVGLSHRDVQKRDGIARFACAETDYHTEIKNRLHTLLAYLRGHYPEIKGRAVVDTAPILEKAWACRGGLGWIGRNSLLINPRLGSFLNLGILLVDVALDEAKGTVRDGCGDCRRCIESCPMGAIGEDRMIDAGICISALTVELQREEGHANEINGWRYGCDTCQECCPWNNLP